MGCDLLEREFVEGGEVQLGEVDGLAEFALLGLGSGPVRRSGLLVCC